MKHFEDIEQWSDAGLNRVWDALEKKILTPEIEQQMEEISAEMARRQERKDNPQD